MVTRSTSSPSSSASRAGEPLSFTQDDDRAPRPLDRVPHQRRGPGEGLPPVAGHDHAAAPARRSRRALGRRLRRGRHGLAVLRQPDRQARRVGARPRARRATACCARSASSRSTASRTTIPAHVALLAHPDFAAGDALHQVGRGRGRPADVRRPRRGRAGDRADGDDDAEPLVERTVPVEVDGKRFSVQAVAARRARRRRGAAAARRGAAAARCRVGGGGGGQRHDHRADAGHDREGARRASATRSRPVRRCSCSRR